MLDLGITPLLPPLMWGCIFFLHNRHLKWTPQSQSSGARETHHISRTFSRKKVSVLWFRTADLVSGSELPHGLLRRDQSTTSASLSWQTGGLCGSPDDNYLIFYIPGPTGVCRGTPLNRRLSAADTVCRRYLRQILFAKCFWKTFRNCWFLKKYPT